LDDETNIIGWMMRQNIVLDDRERERMKSLARELEQIWCLEVGTNLVSRGDKDWTES
jgi:hypothetical protein